MRATTTTTTAAAPAAAAIRAAARRGAGMAVAAGAAVLAVAVCVCALGGDDRTTAVRPALASAFQSDPHSPIAVDPIGGPRKQRRHPRRRQLLQLQQRQQEQEQEQYEQERYEDTEQDYYDNYGRNDGYTDIDIDIDSSSSSSSSIISSSSALMYDSRRTLQMAEGGETTAATTTDTTEEADVGEAAATNDTTTTADETTTSSTTEESSSGVETKASTETEEGGAGGSPEEGSVGAEEEAELEEEGAEPAYAVLFAWFTQALGVIVFFILTRYCHVIPYTAVLFILGTFMGVGAARSGHTDQLTLSIDMWTHINHEVLFAVFLPGLLFKDAFEINFHLFQASFWQLMWLAFPLVLAGTMLTALIGLYIFPYGWTFQFCLVFGCILAATDPVAVAALMNEVGAPPRIKMHISGEALLNDGSAVVFYTVFSALFFYQIGIENEEVSVGEAFVIFFRMALGGTAVGIAYAMALVFILYKLDRRLEAEEQVLQVAASVTVAYLAFYTSEVVCHMSGVIAVVACGILSKAFGGGFINDWSIMNSFWTLLEHLLNTLLFTLGGAIFGEIVSSANGREWDGRDWGYLFLLYILVNVIRFLLLFASYPLLKRIGLGTSWQETTFSSWGGLRGAVGITLALGLDTEVMNSNPTDPEAVVYTTKLFGMVGGVAFLTLIINGSLSGPLLMKLGLVDSTEARDRILKSAEASARRRILGDFLHLMTDPRFSFVDFALVQYHCPVLKDLTSPELEEALRDNKESVHPSVYKQPNLENMLLYVADSGKLRSAMQKIQRDAFMGGDTDSTSSSMSHNIFTLDEEMQNTAHGSGRVEPDVKAPDDLVRDIRLMFVELLRAAYNAQLRDGELDSREYNGFLSYILLQSLDFAHDNANAGQPLDDWNTSQIASPELVEKVEDIGMRFYRCCWNKPDKEGAHCSDGNSAEMEHGNDNGHGRPSIYRGATARLSTLRDEQPFKYQQIRLNVLRAFSFIDAHKEAQDRLRDEFGNEKGEMYAAFRVVLDESKGQMRKAGEVLRSKTSKKQLKHVISHYFCLILQNKLARYYQLLFDSGILLQREVRHKLEEIEHNIEHIRYCTIEEHPGTIHYVEEATYLEGAMPRRKRKKQKSIL